MQVEARVFFINTFASSVNQLEMVHVRLTNFEPVVSIEKVEREKPQRIVLEVAGPQQQPTPVKTYETKMDLFLSMEEWFELQNVLIVGQKIIMEINKNGIKFKK